MKKKSTPNEEKEKAPSPSALDWALKYINLGWAVFPIWSVDTDLHCLCGDPTCSPKNTGKHPVGHLAPHSVKNATTDEVIVRQWFTDTDYNIGIATGAASMITVVDVDTSEGKKGMESWKALTGEKGEPATLMATTGSGGMHVVLKYHSVMRSRNNELGEHIDVKNDGGYIVAAPSRHRSGGTYAWMDWTDVPALADWPTHFVPPGKTEKTETRGRPKKGDPLRRTYGLSDVKAMLDVIPADERDDWMKVGIILGRYFHQSEEAWTVYEEWAGKWTGKKENGHDRHMHDFFYVLSKKPAKQDDVGLGTIIHKAMANGWVPTTGRLSVDAFYFHVGHGYVYRPTMDTWDAANTDLGVSPVKHDGVRMKATEYLQRARMVTCVSSHPALAEYTPDMNMVKGELAPDPGAAILNVYRHATVKLGTATLAKPWVDHCRLLYHRPGDADQFFNYLAHRRQHPGIKPRFALMIGGEQGNGKDTSFEMCLPALGPWNVENISPAHLQSAFNAYLACTLLRVNEAADTRDQSRWVLNEQLKTVIAGMPDHVTINGKYQCTQHIKLYCGVIVTTNHLLSSVFIPEDDRRYDVIETNTLSGMGLTDATTKADYFSKLWGWWYADRNAAGGHVAAWLHERDLSQWSAELGQRKTDAHRSVVQSGMASDEWLIDALDQCKNQNLVSGSYVCHLAVDAGEDPKMLKGRLPHAMERLKYKVYVNPTCKDGRHKINGKLHKIFFKPGWTVEKGWEATLDGYPLFGVYGEYGATNKNGKF